MRERHGLIGGVSVGTLKNIPFPLPPTLEEQQRIANRIETLFAKLDHAKEKAQNVVDTFETRKASILRKAFTGELTKKWRGENGVGDDYAKPFVQTLFSKNNELSSHRFCLQSVCYQTCFVNFIRSFVVQPLMNPFTIEELYKFPETFSQFLCT